MQNKERSAFLFFELADGSTDLGKLALEVTARNTSKNELTVSTPLPNKVLPSKSEVSLEEKPEER